MVLPCHLSSDEVDQEQDSRERESWKMCVGDGNEVSEGQREVEELSQASRGILERRVSSDHRRRTVLQHHLNKTDEYWNCD